jgi:hypothetical protein
MAPACYENEQFSFKSNKHNYNKFKYDVYILFFNFSYS